MADAGPNDMSSGRKRESGDTMQCRERRRLHEQFQAIQKELDDLVTQQFAAFRANDERRFWRLNQKLEPMRDRQERARLALRKHIRTHRCQPLESSRF